MTIDLGSPVHRYQDSRGFVEDAFNQGWADGLPVMPPTVDGVRAILEQLGLAPDSVLGDIPSQDITVTAEQAVVNAVMAGCRPEQMSLALGAVRAFLAPNANAHGVIGSVVSPAFMVLVNGPARATLGINCGAGCFGPGTRANAAVGHALRLVIRNCCNAVPGLADRAVFSQPARYSFCFGEDEEASDWVPLHVERGFGTDENVVTVSSFIEMHALRDVESVAPEVLLTQLALVARHRPIDTDHVLGADRTAVFVIGPEHRTLLVRAGWTKEDVRAYLYPRLTAPPTYVDEQGRPFGWGSGPEGGVAESTWALPDPKGVLLATAGGAGLGLSFVFYPHWSASVSERF